MKMDYFKNVELALSLGFKEVDDEYAYRGKYYIKGHLIWIHDIEALKAKLSIVSNIELRKLNYDVNSYFKYVDFTNDMVDREIERIKNSFNDGESVFFGRSDLLEDQDIIRGMASLAEEGFDDEILADYAHQMSKR